MPLAVLPEKNRPRAPSESNTPPTRYGRVRLGLNYATARKFLEESLTLALESGELDIVADALYEHAMLEGMQDQPDRAARIFGATERLRDAQRISLPILGRADYDRCVLSVRAQLGEAAFTATWAEGQAMHFEQVINYVTEGMSTRRL